jgi:hypothetical protein
MLISRQDAGGLYSRTDKVVATLRKKQVYCASVEWNKQITSLVTSYEGTTVSMVTICKSSSPGIDKVYNKPTTWSGKTL